MSALLASALVGLVVACGRRSVAATRRRRPLARLLAGRQRPVSWYGNRPLREVVVPRTDRRRLAARYEDALPDLLDHAAAAVRAGASTAQALASAAASTDAPVGRDVARAVERTERGEPLLDALDGWRCQARGPAVDLTVAALDLGTRLGGRQAGALHAVGDAVREHIALRREVRALSAQARASAWVMGATPPVFAVLAAMLDPRVAGVLLGRPLGWTCIATGLALDGAAAWWMARIVTAPVDGRR